MAFLSTWVTDVWSMLLVSAPWLLLGLLGAGLLHAALPRTFIAKHMSKPGALSVLKASAFGLPLPLCSCSVIPVGVSLRRAGASRGALASFFVSTPEIGIDSFLLSYVLLGPFFAVTRVCAAFVSAVTAGLGIDLSGEGAGEGASGPAAASCCHSSGSDGVDDEKSVSDKSLLHRVIRFGYIELLDDISKLLVVGFVLAGLVSALVPPEAIAALPLNPFWLSVAMLFVSLPVYVCSVSSTPIAAALLAKGVPAGAILVFLLAGPASNVSTMLVLRRELGGRALAIYLSAVALVALAAACIIDYGIADSLQFQQQAASVLSHADHAEVWQQLAALILLALLSASLFRVYFAKSK